MNTVSGHSLFVVRAVLSGYCWSLVNEVNSRFSWVFASSCIHTCAIHSQGKGHWAAFSLCSALPIKLAGCWRVSGNIFCLLSSYLFLKKPNCHDFFVMQAEMKASSLTVKECTWTTEECHLVEELGAAVETDTFCLPNIFRSRKVKPRRKTPVTPTYQVYYTARELFLEVLDREAIWELIRRAPGVKAGDQRLSHSREQSSVLSEEYAEALMWFSIVLQSGLCVGENCRFSPEPTQKLDKLQGLLKRNSIQSKILSLTELEDGDKLEALSAFCSHIFKRYQVLHSPGPNLTVTKYRLYHQQGQCSLQLALLSDTSSGFVCNMFLYCQQQLQKQSRKPVVEQVVRHLLGPFSSQKRVVQIDSSAWTEGRLQSFLSGVDMNVHFVPVTQNEVRNPTSSLPISPQRLSSEDTFSAHLQGWTGPSLVPHSDLTGSSVDIFLPGLWVALHTVCINTYVLHSLQRLQLSGKQIQLTEFSRALASQLTADHCISVPVLPRLNSCSYQEERWVCVTLLRPPQLQQSKEKQKLGTFHLWTIWSVKLQLKPVQHLCIFISSRIIFLML